MEGIFLSYRRDDTAADAQEIYKRLAGRFGDELVFLDVEDIPLGEDFVEHLTRALAQAAYVLIAIGPRWLLVTDEQGRPRLNDPEDLVRYEVRTALSGKKRVVPLLIGGARMPKDHELPTDIAALVRRNGIAIRHAPDFEADVVQLMKGLHADRIDTARVPTVFHVGLVARNLGVGGAIGWGLAALVLGLLSGEPLAWLALPTAGVISGFTGGGLVGWLTGLLIRHKSPPLVGRKLVRMGLTWSLSLILSIVAAGFLGYFLSQQLLDTPTVEGAGFLETIVGAFVAALAAVLGMILIMFATMLIGLITGSALAGAFFARQFRMRSDQISGRRAVVIATVWLLGGLLTSALFVGLLGLFS